MDNYITYKDSNGTILTVLLDDNVKVVRDSNETKLEKVNTEWGIVKDTAYILYLPN